MVSKAVIFALATTALAHPQRHRFFHGFGSGRPDGVAAPTGAAFPMNNGTSTNSTGFGGTAIEQPSRGLRTVTVSPLPLETTSPNDDGSFSAPEGADINRVANTEVDAAGAGATTTPCLTSTITATSVELVTVTADADPAAAVVSPPADTDVDGLGSSEDDVTISLDEVTPTAAAFYNAPTRGYGGGYGQTTDAVATTFATAYTPAPADTPAATGGSPVQSSAPVSSSIPSTGGSLSGKKGLAYNDASLTQLFSGKGITWAYNWAAGPGGSLPAGVEFVPMCWGAKSVDAWAGAAASAIASGSKHVLSFNEPDHPDQANMDPATAARLHIQHVAPLSGQVSVGSPAITNGGGSMGVAWLESFFSACAGQCNIDFVAFHWYDSASNIQYFKTHVQNVIDLAAKNGVGKVWLTEYGASGSDSDVANFITESVSFLDSTPAVETYAYFMVQNGILVNGNGLSTLGQAYAS